MGPVSAMTNRRELCPQARLSDRRHRARYSERDVFIDAMGLKEAVQFNACQTEHALEFRLRYASVHE
jgi:hypothetical protein